MLPVNSHDPPTTTVVEQLNAVDPTHKRFVIVRIVARLVRAPDMRNVAEPLGATRNFLFEKSVLLKIRFHTRNVSVDIQNLRRKIDILLPGLLRDWNQTRAGNKQRALPMPIALLTSRSGNYFISCGDDGVDRRDITWISVPSLYHRLFRCINFGTHSWFPGFLINNSL